MARKKKKVVYEIVMTCDQCGKALVRTCSRTVGSAICAEGEGIITRNWGEWKFFCCGKCANQYR